VRVILSAARLAAACWSVLFWASGTLRAAVTLDTVYQSGTGGYTELENRLKLSFTPIRRWDDPENIWPFSSIWITGNHVRYDRDNAPDSARAFGAGAGFELFQVVSLEGNFWQMPTESPAEPNAYKAYGWDAAFTAWWNGWWPEIGRVDPRLHGVRSRWRFQVADTQHRERLQIGTHPVTWSELREVVLGGSVTETFLNGTAVKLHGQVHDYNKDIRVLHAQGEYLLVRDTRSGAPLETLRGFAQRTFGLEIAHSFSSDFDAALRARRTYYHVPVDETADVYKAVVTYHFPMLVSLSGSYENFQPDQGRTEGIFALGVRFEF
jgi:hypothetical protein